MPLTNRKIGEVKIIIICLLVILLSISFSFAQTRNTVKSDKLFDDPRIIQWSADFLAGKREQVLKSLKADLISGKPHFFSPHIWVEVQTYLNGKSPTKTDIKNEKLKVSLGILPEVSQLYKNGEYRELLKLYPASKTNNIRDPIVLKYLFSAAIEECQYDAALDYVIQLSKVYPDYFYVSLLMSDHLFEVERIRSKIDSIFGANSDLGKTVGGRFIKRKLEIYLTPTEQNDEFIPSIDKEKEALLFADEWVRKFPRNAQALSFKATKEPGWLEKRKIDLLTQSNTAYPFSEKEYLVTGKDYLEIAIELIKAEKRVEAEVLLTKQAALLTKDSLAAKNLAEELLARALFTANLVEESIKILDRALQTRPNEPTLLYLRSMAELDNKSAENLIKFSTKALEILPNKPDWFEALISHLAKNGHYEQAQKLFAIGEKKYSQKSPTFLVVGVYAWTENNEENINPEAWRILKAGQKEYPESQGLMFYESILLLISKRQTEGREKLKQLFTLTLPNKDLIDLLRLLQSEMSFEEKETECRQLLNTYPFVKEFEKYIRKLELYIQTGTISGVRSLAFSPDGKILASGHSFGAIKFWDTATGQDLKTLKQPGDVNSLAFSPDSKILVSASDSGNGENLIVWDVGTGQEVKRLRGHISGINSVAFSPNGKILASAGKDKFIVLWDLNTGNFLKSFPHGVETEVRTVAFSPDGKTLAFCGSMDTKLWSIEKEKVIKTFNYTGSSIGFSSNGNLLAGNSWRLFKDITPQMLTDDQYKTSTLEPDGNQEEYTPIIWDLKKMEYFWLPGIHTNLISSISFSPDSKMLATGSFDNEIKLWDVAVKKELRTLKGHNEGISAVTFSPDGKRLASGSNITIRLWDVNSGEIAQTIGSNLSSSGIRKFSPNGKQLAMLGSENIIKLWDFTRGNETKTLVGHTRAISSLEFSSDGKILASGGSDKTLKLWDLKTLKELATIKHPNSVYGASFSPDNQLVISTSHSDSKSLFNVSEVSTGKILWNVDGKRLSLQFSHDSNLIAGYGNYQTIMLWDARTGKELLILSGYNRTIYYVAFSPDNKFLASKDDELNIRYWDLTSGKEVFFSNKLEWATLENEQDKISVNNKKIKVTHENEQIKLVDVNTKQTLARLITLNEKDWIVFSPDGRFNSSAGSEKLMNYSYGLEIINLDQLKKMYYEPGLLQKILGFSKEPLRPIVPLKDVKLYPEIVEQKFDEKSKKLTVKLKNRGGGIGETRVLVNDKMVVADARDENLKKNPLIANDAIVTLTADLKGASFLKSNENNIKVITSNFLREIGKGNIQSRGAESIHLDSEKEELKLPSLYAIVGGVSDYDGSQIDLRFAAKDAEDFSNALSLGAKRLFCDKSNINCTDKVQITTLSTDRKNADEQPIKENFKKAFAAIAAKAKPEDIIVIYLAGHGVSLGAGTDSYFYLTKESRSASKEDLAKVYQTAAISSTELTEWLTTTEWQTGEKGIKALKQVLILDTCAAGTAAGQLALTAKRDLSGDQIRAIEFLKDKTGTFVLMGSTADAPSYEASQFAQGLLTYSLLQAMQGADLDKGEYVDVRKLFTFAEQNVPKMATNIGGVQKPIVSAPLGKTFVIGQMTNADRQKINLPTPKPILLRPQLGVLPRNNDPLNLNAALRKGLDAESSYEFVRQRGDKEPILIYVDDDSLPNGIQISGTYKIEGETIKVKIYLFRGEKEIAELDEISAPKEDISQKLLETVHKELVKLN